MPGAAKVKGQPGAATTCVHCARDPHPREEPAPLAPQTHLPAPSAAGLLRKGADSSAPSCVLCAAPAGLKAVQSLPLGFMPALLVSGQMASEGCGVGARW